MTEQEKDIALAEIEASSSIPTSFSLKSVIAELSDTLHESIGEITDYSTPEINCIARYRQSDILLSGRESWEISISFRYGYFLEIEKELFAREATIDDCITAIHHLIAEFVLHLNQTIDHEG